jgi:hypothetical protein
MQDLATVVVIVMALGIMWFLGFSTGHDSGRRKATADVCETKRVTCKVPDAEIKIP